MVAQAKMNFVGIEPPHAPGEMDLLAEVRKKMLPGGEGCPCQGVGAFFLS